MLTPHNDSAPACDRSAMLIRKRQKSARVGCGAVGLGSLEWCIFSAEQCDSRASPEQWEIMTKGHLCSSSLTSPFITWTSLSLSHMQQQYTAAQSETSIMLSPSHSVNTVQEALTTFSYHLGSLWLFARGPYRCCKVSWQICDAWLFICKH